MVCTTTINKMPLSWTSVDSRPDPVENAASGQTWSSMALTRQGQERERPQEVALG